MLTPRLPVCPLWLQNKTTCRLLMREPWGRREGDHGENTVPCSPHGCLKHYTVLYPHKTSRGPHAEIRTAVPAQHFRYCFVNTWRHQSASETSAALRLSSAATILNVAQKASPHSMFISVIDWWILVPHRSVCRHWQIYWRDLKKCHSPAL